MATPLVRAMKAIFAGDFDNIELICTFASTDPVGFLSIVEAQQKGRPTVSPTALEVPTVKLYDTFVHKMQELTEARRVPAANCVDAVLILLEAEQYVGAIKHVRTQFGTGLKETKAVIDYIRDNRKW